MRKLSRSLSDCQSLTLNMSWFQFLNFSGKSERSYVSTTALQCSEDDKIKTSVIHSLTDNFTNWAEAKKEHNHSAIRKVPVEFVMYWAELRKVTEKSCSLALLQKQQFFLTSPHKDVRLCTWVVNWYLRFSIYKGHSLTHSLKWYYWNLNVILAAEDSNFIQIDDGTGAILATSIWQLKTLRTVAESM